MSAPADRTVPGTRPVEYTLKCVAALSIMQIIHCYLSFGTFSNFCLLPGCFILVKRYLGKIMPSLS